MLQIGLHVLSAVVESTEMLSPYKVVMANVAEMICS